MELARTETVDDFLLVGCADGETAGDPLEKLRCKSAIFAATPVPKLRRLWMDKASSEGLSMVPEEVRDIEGFDVVEGDLSREPSIFAADEMRDFFEAGLSVCDFAGKLDFRGAKV